MTKVKMHKRITTKIDEKTSGTKVCSKSNLIIPDKLSSNEVKQLILIIFYCSLNKRKKVKFQ